MMVCPQAIWTMVIEDFAWQFPFEELTVYIESDRRTCYAYAGSQDGDIYNFYGDVWLFNCGPAPEVPPWKNGEHPPFANPIGLAREFDLGDEIVPSDFDVSAQAGADRITYVISFRGRPIGTIWDGAHPGCSRFALCDGPVAMVLSPPLGLS